MEGLGLRTGSIGRTEIDFLGQLSILSVRSCCSWTHGPVYYPFGHSDDKDRATLSGFCTTCAPSLPPTLHPHFSVTSSSNQIFQRAKSTIRIFRLGFWDWGRVWRTKEQISTQNKNDRRYKYSWARKTLEQELRHTRQSN